MSLMSFFSTDAALFSAKGFNIPHVATGLHSFNIYVPYVSKFRLG